MGGEASLRVPASVVEALCVPVLKTSRRQGFDGMAVSQTLPAVAHAGVLYSSSRLADQLEALQQTLGEGPGVAALQARAPVLIPDLAADYSAVAWLAFVGEALDLGVGSIFSFPVQVGAIGLGSVTMHGLAPMALADDTFRALLILTDRLALAMLTPAASAANAPTPEDDLLEASQLVVHQAVGMVSVQLECALADALAALRARAYSDGLTLPVLARRVVSREIGFHSGLGKSDYRGNDGETA